MNTPQIATATPASAQPSREHAARFRRTTLSWCCAATLGICFATTGARAAFAPVNPPDFNLPQIGFYGSWTYPNGGWILNTGAAGDINANPCAPATGAKVKRTGLYAANGMNIAEAWCAPNYYWIYGGWGTAPLGAAYDQAAQTPTGGFCLFNMTVGDQLRTADPNALTVPPPVANHFPAPSPAVPYTFDVGIFAQSVIDKLNTGLPAPVGFQLAVRDPNGKLVYSTAVGSVTGYSGLPATPMTKERRFNVASMSKTITAVAVMAALEDLAEHQPQLGISLDSSIAPFLPSNWDRTKVVNTSIRQLLRHTSGFVTNGADDYATLKNMVEKGPVGPVGTHKYYNGNYALLRIILPYLVDGPQAFEPFESVPAVNAQVTGLAYRNYVRGKIFAPLGLSAVDVFHTGPLPETIYFSVNQAAIPDKINIPGDWYDFRANNMVLTAGPGNWTLSAEEYSWFISKLWLGKIISSASLTELLPQDDPGAYSVGGGMFGNQVFLCKQGQGWNYGHNGSGIYLNQLLAGPQGQWMTFFNGYTAVLLDNTPGAAFLPLATCLMSALTSTSSKVVCPNDIYVSNDPGQCGAKVEFSPNTDGTCGIALLHCSPKSGSIFPIGQTVVTCEDKSSTGPRYAPGSFTVTVNDTQAPALGPLVDLVVNATSPSGAHVLYQPPVSDNCPGVKLYCYPASGTLFPIGDSSVTCIAADAWSNQNSGFFKIHVKGGAEQISDLSARLSGMSIANVSLKKKLLSCLNAALGSLQKNDSVGACNSMQLFIDLINGQRLQSINSGDVEVLLNAAKQIRTVLGC